MAPGGGAGEASTWPGALLEDAVDVDADPASGVDDADDEEPDAVSADAGGGGGGGAEVLLLTVVIVMLLRMHVPDAASLARPPARFVDRTSGRAQRPFA